MGRLSQTVEEQTRKITNRPEPPSWFPVLGAVAAVLIGIWLVFAGVADYRADQQLEGTLDKIETARQRPPAATQPTQSDNDNATEPAVVAGDGPTTELPTLTGETATVPQAALDVATAGVTAEFTGKFADVPTAGDPPAISTVFPDVVTTEPHVQTIGKDVITFTFTVDPDGPDGDLAARPFDGTAVFDGSTWLYLTD